MAMREVGIEKVKSRDMTGEEAAGFDLCGMLISLEQGLPRRARPGYQLLGR